MTDKAQNSKSPFECICCGDCCNGYGGTVISGADIEKIARFLDMDRDLFLETYCVKSPNGWMIAQREDGFCHFVKDKRCSIHPVKPRICRAWPYLESVLTDLTNWEAMASVCPGINKQADPQEIIAAVKAQIVADKN